MTMNASHPPIPPNCPYFVERYGSYAFLLLDVFSLIIQSSPLRPIIAAVARCAWLDEENAKCQELRVGKGHDGCMVWLDKWDNVEVLSEEWTRRCIEQGRRLEIVSECWRNAEAWRKWGLGEDWNE